MNISCPICLPGPTMTPSVADPECLMGKTRCAQSRKDRSSERWKRRKLSLIKRIPSAPSRIKSYPKSTQPRGSAQCAPKGRKRWAKKHYGTPPRASLAWWKTPWPRWLPKKATMESREQLYSNNQGRHIVTPIIKDFDGGNIEQSRTHRSNGEYCEDGNRGGRRHRKKREVWRQKFAEAVCSIGARSALSSGRPQIEISDKRTNKKTYSATSEKSTTELGSWNKIKRAGINSGKNTPKTAKELDVSGRRVIEPVNDRFTAVVDYWNYCLMKKSFCYDDDVAHELHKMVKKTAVQMKDHMVSGKTVTSVIAVLQDFKLACDARRTFEGTAM